MASTYFILYSLYYIVYSLLYTTYSLYICTDIYCILRTDAACVFHVPGLHVASPLPPGSLGQGGDLPALVGPVG